MRKFVGLALLAAMSLSAAPSGAATVSRSRTLLAGPEAGISVAGERVNLMEAGANWFSDFLPPGLRAVSPELLGRFPLPSDDVAQHLRARSQQVAQDVAEEPTESDAADAAPAATVTVRELADLTGDGVADLYAHRRLQGAPSRGSVLDGASGAVAWTQDDLPSAVSVVADVDGDAVGDLAMVHADVVTFREVYDEDEDVTTVGLEVDYRTRSEVRSGRDGALLWESDAQDSGFAFLLRGHDSVTSIVADPEVGIRTANGLGFEVRSTNWPSTPLVLAGPAPRVIDERSTVGARVDQVWHGAGLSEPPAAWAYADTTTIDYDLSTRTEIVDLLSGVTDQVLETPGRSTLAATTVLSDVTGDGRDDVAYTRLVAPDDVVTCHRDLVCSDELEASHTLTSEIRDGATLASVRSLARSGAFSIGATIGVHTNGSGEEQLLIDEIVPTGDTFSSRIAVGSLSTGTWSVVRDYGARVVDTLALYEWDGHGSVLHQYEITTVGFGQHQVILERTDLATGATLPTSAYTLAPVAARAGVVATEPYVWATIAVVALDTTGDTDGDGIADIAVSLMRREQWSDDRPPTVTGTWRIVSGFADRSQHQGNASNAFVYALGSEDVSGDGLAEFLLSTAPDAAMEHDGATGVARRLRPATDRVIADRTGDRVADYLRVTHGGNATRLQVLDGPTHASRWTVDVD